MAIAAGLVAPEIAWGELTPVLALLGGTCVLLLLGSLVPRWPRWGTVAIPIVSALVALVAYVGQWRDLGSREGFTIVVDALTIDRFAAFGSIIIVGAVIVAALMMSVHHDPVNGDQLEQYALLLTSAIGAVVMVGANELIVLFMGLEILSLSLYLMAASDRRRTGSQEAGLKYFVLGGFASAFLLYGIALVYGSTGSTSIDQIAAVLGGEVVRGSNDAMLLVGIAMLLVGFGFKVSAAPFQSWTPDVYQGSPTAVTSYMASAGKVAAFAALLRVFLVGLETRVDDWRPVVAVIAVATVFVGSIMAVVQTDVKRMLAYSSISHAGFILVGVEAASHEGSDGLASSMSYLAIYTMLVLGSFAIIQTIAGRDDADTSLSAFKGLATRRPSLALAFSAILFAQAGVPFTSGFVAKFGVIKSSVEAGSYAVAVAAMVGAVIGAFVYLRITVGMWLEAAESDQPVRVPRALGVVIVASVAATLVLGFFPSILVDVAGSVVFAR